MAPILSIQLRQWSNSQGGVTVNAERTLPLPQTHVPVRAHARTHAQTKRQQRRQWGWVIVTEQLHFKFGLPPPVFSPYKSLLLLQKSARRHAALCTLFRRCKIACAVRVHVVHKRAYVRVFARCAYINWYRRALSVCVCFVLLDKHCDAELFISFKFQRPYVLVADEFKKKRRYGSRALTDAANGGGCQFCFYVLVCWLLLRSVWHFGRTM